MGNGLPKLDGPTHVVMVGMDSAGKTTVLYRLKYEQYVNTMPTVGFNCEKVKGTLGKAKGVSFIIWDVGGQDKVRQLWRSYTRATDGIVFVVDSADLERMEEAKVELMRTAKAPETAGVPIIVVANKQDLPQALDASNVERQLSLSEIATQGSRSVKVAPACAITGEGLEAALEQLYSMIQDNRKRKSLKKKR